MSYLDPVKQVCIEGCPDGEYDTKKYRDKTDCEKCRVKNCRKCNFNPNECDLCEENYFNYEGSKCLKTCDIPSGY